MDSLRCDLRWSWERSRDLTMQIKGPDCSQNAAGKTLYIRQRYVNADAELLVVTRAVADSARPRPSRHVTSCYSDHPARPPPEYSVVTISILSGTACKAGDVAGRTVSTPDDWASDEMQSWRTYQRHESAILTILEMDIWLNSSNCVKKTAGGPCHVRYGMCGLSLVIVAFEESTAGDSL